MIRTFHKRVLCQNCPDLRRVQRASEDAKRISTRLREMMDGKIRLTYNRNGQNRLFQNFVHCKLTGSSCSNFSQKEKELRQAERELEITFSVFLEELKTLDEKEARARKGLAYDLLRGHYPRAVRLLKI